jgi:hypothetical protein
MPSRAFAIAQAVEVELNRWSHFIDESSDLRQVNISVRMKPGSFDTRSVVFGTEHERSTKPSLSDRDK